MEFFDLCLAWNWEYDPDFANLLEAACQRQGFSFLQVNPSKLWSTVNSLRAGEIGVRAFFDRASDSDSSFLALEEWMVKHNIFQINPRRKLNWTHDKTLVHLAFLEAGIPTPYTYLLPSFNSQPENPSIDFQLLGSKFAIKPATGGGGGEGVVLDASSLEQVKYERRKNPFEKYLIQNQLEPYFINGHEAWFRVLVCYNFVHPCWWDPKTHRYSIVTKAEEDSFHLSELVEVAKKISVVCKMDLFSSEIAVTSTGRFLVVDYVNDPVDLRLQSKAYDGVPDLIIENITTELVTLVKEKLSQQFPMNPVESIN